MRSTVLLGLVACLVAAGAPRRDEKPADDLAGTWEGRSALKGGMEGRFRTVWDVKAGKIVSTRPGQDKASEWKYWHDPKTAPKQIDLTPDAGPWAGKVLKGIYKVEGDTLTVCHIVPTVGDPETSPRPTEFDATTRDDAVVVIFERKKR